MLTNAIKFTRKGNIIVKAVINPILETNNEFTLKVSVTDDGIGMSKEEANRVFDGNFATRDQDSRALNPYSNGIGLSLCKQLCQSLDGTITVKSAIGKGSIFSFTMIVKGIESFIGSAGESEGFKAASHGRDSKSKEAEERVNADQVDVINDSQFLNVIDADF